LARIEHQRGGGGKAEGGDGAGCRARGVFLYK
jgi:hypothetical protein